MNTVSAVWVPDRRARYIGLYHHRKISDGPMRVQCDMVLVPKSAVERRGGATQRTRRSTDRRNNYEVKSSYHEASRTFLRSRRTSVGRRTTDIPFKRGEMR